MRGRFGITPREARAKLARIKRFSKTPLQQHANEVGRLITLGYAELDNQQRRGLTVEAFTNSLDNPQLQHHLLAVNTPDIPSAVRACNEFLNIKAPTASNIRQVEGDNTDQVHDLTTQDRESLNNLAKVVQGLTDAVAGLQQENIKIRQGQKGSKRSTERKGNPICWGCGEEEHQRKNCQTHPWPSEEKPEAGPGNEARPQQ